MPSADEPVEEAFPELLLRKEERERPPVTCDVYTSELGESADQEQWYKLLKLCDTLSIDEKINCGKQGVIKLAVSVLRCNCGETLHALVCLALTGLFIDVENNRTLAYSNGIEDALMLVNGLHPLSKFVFHVLVQLIKTLPELYTLSSLKIQSTQMNTALGTRVSSSQYKQLLIRGRANISLDVHHVAWHDAIIYKSIGHMIISENMFASGHQSELACWFYNEGLVHEMLAKRPWINKDTSWKLTAKQCMQWVQLGINYCDKRDSQPFYFDTADIGKFYWLLGKMMSDNENSRREENTSTNFADVTQVGSDILANFDSAVDDLQNVFGYLPSERLNEARNIMVEGQNQVLNDNTQIHEVKDRHRLKLCCWMIRESHFMSYSAGTLLLAKCYFNGTGVKRNIEIGFNLLTEAYMEGNTDALAICGALSNVPNVPNVLETNTLSPDITSDYKQAFELLTLAVESGYDGHWFPNFKSIPNCESVFEFELFVKFLKCTANNDELTFAIRSSANAQLLNISKCYGSGAEGLVMNLNKAVIFAKASSLHDGFDLNKLRRCSCCGRNPARMLYCPCFAKQYCNRECQKHDWESNHKNCCKFLKCPL